jgi:hypothetical protein
MTKSPAQIIIENIRRRHSSDPYDIMKAVDPQPKEIKFAKCYLSADGWQLFSSRFVESIDGEPVQPTGLTNSAFLHYLKTSGERENDQFTERQRLQALLRKLDNENPPV